jgi:uncharacterized protein YbjT (DUF2867 family)
MYVVTGVSGHTGAVVAKTLLDRGEKVRVVVRSADKGRPFRARGAEVAVASLEDAEATTRAFTGATGVYLLSPPDLLAVDLVGDRRRMFDGLARVIEATGIGHVVFLSSMGAQHPKGTGPIVLLHHAEQALGDKTALTTLRAGYFLYNYRGMLPMARVEGILRTFLPPMRAVPTVVTDDIGATAAEACWPDLAGVASSSLHLSTRVRTRSAKRFRISSAKRSRSRRSRSRPSCPRS